ncbi:MAG: DNA primase catalytic subunit PriS, partial [Candidatus Thermoplasmatota archaeon]|nr:DNA primase catalytic subunit PriS [Candidatus Thermoplasmatota archaeon]
EPVTTDVHRLIRFPGSLHGKTGLEVVPVPIDELGGFDPLKSAIPDVFMEGEEEVIAPQRIEISMAGKEFVLESGLNKVPTYLAIFLVAQKKCKLK